MQDLKQDISKLKTVANYAKKANCSVDWVRKLHKEDRLIEYGERKGVKNKGLIIIDGVQFVKID